MTTATYPQRVSHYAYRYCRFMAKTCLGASIGPDACWLLTIIATTEDARWYSSPVKFFNANLADQLGMSISSLDRCRQKAIDAGWLHYVPGLRSIAGEYWTLIPESEMEKWNNSLPRQSDERNDDTTGLPTQSDEASGRKPRRQPEGNRVGNRKATDDPSYLIPNHIPGPDEDSSEPAPPTSEPTANPPPISTQCVPEIPDPSGITFPVKAVKGDASARIWPLPAALVEILQEAYPALDVLGEIRKARAWIEANPMKRKTASGMAAFLTGWMSRVRPDDASSGGYRTRAERENDFTARQVANFVGGGRPGRIEPPPGKYDGFDCTGSIDDPPPKPRGRRLIDAK